jgi:hypothetical protein
MALSDSDLFLINRGGTDFKTKYSTLVSSLNVDLDGASETEIVTIINNILGGNNPDGSDNDTGKVYLKVGDNISALNNDKNYVVDVVVADNKSYVRNNNAWAVLDVDGDLATLETDLKDYIDDQDAVIIGNLNDLTAVVAALNLDDLNDCNVTSPSEGQQLVYSGGEWVAQDDAFANQSVKFKGIIDVSDSSQLPAINEAGDVYIQHQDSEEDATADVAFVGIAGELVNEGQYVMYGSDGFWHKGKTIENVAQINTDYDELDTNSPSYLKNREKLVMKNDYIANLSELS